MNEPDIERLLAGRAPGDEQGLDGVVAFFESVTLAYPEPTTDACEAAHVAAMLEAAGSVAYQGVPATAHGRRRVTIFGSAAAFRRLLTRPGSVAAGVGLAVALALGGTAYAGILPAPLQALVARAAHQVGISVPDPTAHPLGSVHPVSAGASSVQKGTIGSQPGPQGAADSISASASAGVHPGGVATATAPARRKSAQPPRSSGAKSRRGRKAASKTHPRLGPHGASDGKARGSGDTARR